MYTRTGTDVTGASRWGVKPTPPPVDIGDTSRLVGQWFIDRDRARWELVLRTDEGRLSGTMTPEGATEPGHAIHQPTWDGESGQLRFRVEEDGQTAWYAMTVVEGVSTGRYAITVGDRVAPSSWSSYSGHVVGWRQESFDDDIVPRVFDIAIGDGRKVRLRIDRGERETTPFVGELKTKATTLLGSAGELPIQSVLVRRWDGQQIVFDLANGNSRQRFSGAVTGRGIEGTMLDDLTGAVTSFAGVRANVLTYGLRPKATESRREWQERTRRMLARLLMGGNPSPIATRSTIKERPLLRSDQVAPNRDDDSARWRQDYKLSDVVLEHTLPNPYGTEPLSRRSHGLLAVPATPPPPEGYTIVVTLNGHGGSAEGTFQPDDGYWYADSYARRGYVVFAVDISHRLPSDVNYMYEDPVDGDDPDRGNHAHPAIAAPGMDSDWSDDGERAWDAMRGIDFLLTQQQVNPAKIIVTGLSMGGGVTELVAALDPRVTIAIPAGAPPDLAVMAHHPNHACWWWTHGEPPEFIESSDLLALVAPRPVLLESGKWDYTYTSYATPYAVDKENAWRARIAYGDDAANFVHFLHSGGHEYRVGDVSADSPDPGYIQVPQVIAPPVLRRRTVDWEVDGETVSLKQTLFDYIGR